MFRQYFSTCSSARGVIAPGPSIFNCKNNFNQTSLFRREYILLYLPIEFRKTAKVKRKVQIRILIFSKYIKLIGEYFLKRGRNVTKMTIPALLQYIPFTVVDFPGLTISHFCKYLNEVIFIIDTAIHIYM